MSEASHTHPCGLCGRAWEHVLPPEMGGRCIYIESANVTCPDCADRVLDVHEAIEHAERVMRTGFPGLCVSCHWWTGSRDPILVDENDEPRAKPLLPIHNGGACQYDPPRVIADVEGESPGVFSTTPRSFWPMTQGSARCSKWRRFRKETQLP